MRAVPPVLKEDAKAMMGKLSDTIIFEKDIISPFGEELWDACKSTTLPGPFQNDPADQINEPGTC